MANWEKLKNELDTTLNGLSEKDWENWAAKREIKKSLRRAILNIMAELQCFKIEEQQHAFGQILNNALIVEVNFVDRVVNFDLATKRNIISKSLSDYTHPIAA